MKGLLLSCLILLLAWRTIRSKKTAAYNETKTEILIKDTISFSNQVKPIFIKNCSPCHFPGGKMYLRMPFDQDTTIINHQAGILRRIKDKEENFILKKFLAQN